MIYNQQRNGPPGSDSRFCYRISRVTLPFLLCRPGRPGSAFHFCRRGFRGHIAIFAIGAGPGRSPGRPPPPRAARTPRSARAVPDPVAGASPVPCRRDPASRLPCLPSDPSCLPRLVLSLCLCRHPTLSTASRQEKSCVTHVLFSQSRVAIQIAARVKSDAMAT